MGSTRLHTLRTPLFIALLMLLAPWWHSPASAQPTPVITANGETGVVYTLVGEPLVIQGSGFTESGSIAILRFTTSDCSGDPSSSSGYAADAFGQIIVAGQPLIPEVIYTSFEDLVLGRSNCLTIHVVESLPETPTATNTEVPPTATSTTAPRSPVISVNGITDTVVLSTGPEEYVLSGTGFFPLETRLTTYTQPNCQGTSTYTPIIVEPDGTFAMPIASVLPIQMSFQALDPLSGISNCLTVIFEDPTPTATNTEVPPTATNTEVPPTATSTLPSATTTLSVNGIADTVTLPTGTVDHILHGTGFDFISFVHIYSYSEADCMGESAPYDLVLASEFGTFDKSFTGSPVADQMSFLAIDPITGLSDCLTIIFEDPTPTATNTATEIPPTEVPPTATNTATEVPPTATEEQPPSTNEPSTATTVPPTSTVDPPTATDIPPTEQPTQVPAGGAAITITTSTGDEIPDDTTVCIGEVCQDLDAIAGSSALNAFVSAAATSGTTVNFSELDAGTHPLTVSTGGEVVISTEITIEAGVSTTMNLTYQLESDSTPVVPTATSDDGAQPTQPPVVTLPSTGSGSGSPSAMTMLLLVGALASVASVAVLRRRTRV